MVVSKETFKQKISVPQAVIYPSIDPLTPKNKKIGGATVNKFLKKFGVERDKPIVSQVSRFDKWKDPVGVIQAFKLVRKRLDCRLVLLGSMAWDDPEGQKIYDKIIKITNGDPDIHVINYSSDVLVNAVQRASSVVIQKSLREGFGITVSEALWKKTPVVGSNVGGIGLQIRNGYNGYLVDSPKSCALATLKLLQDPKKAEKMGEAGHEFVKKHFLITRHFFDYIRLLKKQL
jgi:trehalose synthase